MPVRRLVLSLSSGIIASLGLAHAALAVPQDTLAIGSTSLSLAETSVNFFSTGGANAVDVGTSTGAFAGLAGDPATLQDLNLLAPPPLANFLAIPALPQAQFTLSSVGPGSPNTNCAGLVLNQSCSPIAGSPFTLTVTAAGTVASFSAIGSVKDAAGAPTNFTAIFSTEFIGQSAAAVQAKLATGGSFAAPFTASINVPSGTFAGTLNIGLSAMSLQSTAIGFSPTNTIGPASTGAFAPLVGTTATLSPISGSLPVPNFLGIAGLPNVHFTLTSVGPGAANTNCAAVVTIGDSCSAFPGSPFVLVRAADGTVVSFLGAGTALDTSTLALTTFEAIFSTEATGETPVALQTLLLGGGTLDDPFSVEFLAGPFASETSVPEPGTLAVFALGLAALGFARRHRVFDRRA